MPTPSRKNGELPNTFRPQQFHIRPAGESAILIEAESAETVRPLTNWVNSHRLRQRLRQAIPATKTLFLSGDPLALRVIGAELESIESIESLPIAREGKRVVVDVRYDGEDLAEVADRVGLSPREIVALHCGADHVVEFFGFAPGQAFFGGLPAGLQIPRRRTPRTLVPAGALAIANGFTVIYPQHSPGGWNLIGTRVSEPLWDIRNVPPNRLEVGDVVRFRPCP